MADEWRGRARIAAAGWILAVTGPTAAIGGCQSTGGPGAACQSPGDCQSGLECLYAIGAGCDAQGACDVPPNGCLPGASTLVLCACADAQIDLACIGDNATLQQPTATGSVCGAASDGSDQ